MRILYITTIGMTMRFFEGLIGHLVEKGNEIHIACNNEKNDLPEFYTKNNIKQYELSCSRNPFNKGNFLAIKQIREIVENEQFDIVHCHTPIAAMCTRLACIKQRKKGTRVIYTAHGFHFYKGAPLKNWLIYYPIEKICAYFTDVLVTINKEDYNLAKRRMKAKKIEYVPGVGIDTERFLSFELSNEQKSQLRKEIGVPVDAKLLVSVGELNENKNHKVVLEALSLLKDKNIHYAVAGFGDKEEYLKNLAKELGLEDRFHLLGYRKDVEKLYKLAELCCFPSIREGLGLAAIEGMACGLPLVVANNRGTRDYCINGNNGFMCNPFKPKEFADAIEKLINDSDLCKKISQSNIIKAQEFGISRINQEMMKIYFN